MEIIFTSAFIAALLLAACYFWRYTLAVLAVIVLMISCSRADNLRFEVSAVIESDAARTSMQDAVDYAARILRDQFATDLVVTYVDVGTVAGHTNAHALLDALKAHRVDNTQHRAADATVLFTRREMRGYAGIATVGPSCSAQASAIVALRNDGYDGQILAHELLHTVGVPHDHAGGWLMSESPSRSGSDTASTDSVLTFKAAGAGECMTVAKPAPTAAPAASQPSGGGGGMGEALLAVLCLIAALRWYCDAQRKGAAAYHWRRKYRQLRRDLRNCDAVVDGGVMTP